jgi:hypothetical protein
MKKAFILPAFVLLISLGACRKCVICTVSDSNGNVLVDKEETCGSREDRDLAKDKARDQALLISGSYTCEE